MSVGDVTLRPFGYRIDHARYRYTNPSRGDSLQLGGACTLLSADSTAKLRLLSSLGTWDYSASQIERVFEPRGFFFGPSAGLRMYLSLSVSFLG